MLYRKFFTATLTVSLLALTGVQVASAHKYEFVIGSNEQVKAGRRNLRQGRLDKAISHFHNAMKANLSSNDTIWVNNDLCVAYYLKGDFDLANQHCDEAISLAPNKWQAHNNKGNIHYAVGNYEGAIRSYQRALELNPNSRVLADNIMLTQNVINKQKQLAERGSTQ